MLGFYLCATPKGNKTFKVRFRIVGIYDAQERSYHLYVTNIPASRLVEEDIDHLYRLRWEVETFYKTGKSGLGLNEISSTKPHIVRTFIKAALVRASVAMQAKCEAEANLPPGRWINPMQWTQVWRSALLILLDDMLGLVRRLRPMTWEQLAHLAMDPNRNREPTRYWLELVEPAKCTI